MPTVRMYTLSTCGYCKATKLFLAENSVKYEFTDIDLLTGDKQRSVIEEMKKLNPLCTFPTIVIGDRVIVGFKKDEIREALGIR